MKTIKEIQELKNHFEQKFTNDIKKFWDRYTSYSSKIDLINSSIKYSILENPSIEDFAPIFSFDRETYKISITYRTLEETQEIKDVANYIYERFLEKIKTKSEKLKKSSINLYYWNEVDNKILLESSNGKYCFSEVSRGSDIGGFIISSKNIFLRIIDPYIKHDLKRDYNQEVFESFISHFFPELHGCRLNQNLLKIKELT